MSHSCPGNAIPEHLLDGTPMCRTPVELECRPPTVPTCSPALLGPICRCEAPRPIACEARVSYPADNPGAAVVTTSPGCDGMVAVIALAAALAKLSAAVGAP